MTVARRTRARVAGMAALGLAAAAALGLLVTPGLDADAAPRGQDDRPNVIVIMTDDQRVDDLAVMPKVKRLLTDRGVSFTNYYATFPLCCPSRVSYLTGQYSHNHGVLSNKEPDGGFAGFDADSATLPVALRQAGYRTGFIGKYLNGYGNKTQEVHYEPPGWVRWYGSLKNRMFDFPMNVNGKRVTFRGKRNYAADVETGFATSFVRQSARRKKPFFLTLATRAAHTETGVAARQDPRPAPRHRGAFRGMGLPSSPSINEENTNDKPSFIPGEPLSADRMKRLRIQNRSRRESLLAVDEGVARVLKTLRKEKEMGNTWVFLLSDNGYMLGEHRLSGKSRFYEEAARVPLIVRGPGVAEGELRPQLVGNVDLAPTILDLAEAAPAPGMAIDGRSLLPQIGDRDAAANRDLLLETRNDRAVREGNWLWAEHETDPGSGGPDEFELYNLEEDPFQLDNRYQDSLDPGPLQNRRQELQQRLDQIRACAGSACP
jgi:N-acetylglucosamine-6-sulfatase